jgi:regulator of cell morphogenesis and NO signaling
LYFLFAEGFGSLRYPESPCSTHVVNYEKPKEFEADLQKHVHLENSILIPKVEQLIK